MNNQVIPQIGLIGMSHKTAPVEFREKFALCSSGQPFSLSKIKNHTEEAVIISTCNRMEIYFTSTAVESSVEAIMNIYKEYTGLSEDVLLKNIYRKYNRDAVRHLLTVSASLDSMVIGENEISAQVKEAYRKAIEEKTTGQVLNRLFHQAFKTAKKVRTETEISRNPLSIAYIATELAKNIFEDISRRKALLIGAGEMGELILKYLTKQNVKDITIANRSFHNARKIAEEINSDSSIVTLDDIGNVAAQSDIIISSASSGHLIDEEKARKIIKSRCNNPVFIIDISVPRSISPDAANVTGIFLYNIDDLKMIADENLKNRHEEAVLAKKLIESDTDIFMQWYDGLEIVPAIISIQDAFDKIRRSELKKFRNKKLKHLTDKDFGIIEDMTNQIMTKTLHNPITRLKECQNSENTKKIRISETLSVIELLFGRKNK